MKSAVKKFLQQKGWYEYIRYSLFFSVYAWLFKREVINDHRKEVAFYKFLLPHCSLIFDIGAYDGHKTAAFLQISDRVVSCEPDAYNFSVLKSRFRNKLKKVFPENKALSDHMGTEEYYIHHAGSAFNTLNPKWKQILEDDKENRWNENIQFSNQATVELTTIDELIRQYGKPGFIKIDVEGYEEFVLRGLSEKIPFITFECLLPDCTTELINCLKHLLTLDASVTFNVVYEEKLQFQNFMNYNEIINWIPKAPPRSFEIIAKMTG